MMYSAYKLNKQGGNIQPTYSFSYLEPVCCSMSSSNCRFLTCIQISQEAGQVVWYSHLFKENRWGNNGNSGRLNFLGVQNHRDGDFSHKIEITFSLEEIYDKLSVLKNQRHRFANKGPYRAMVFPLAMYRCENWTIKKVFPVVMYRCKNWTIKKAEH